MMAQKTIPSRGNKHVILIKAPCCGKRMPPEAACSSNDEISKCPNAQSGVMRRMLNRINNPAKDK